MLGEAVPAKGLLLGFPAQKGRAPTPHARPPGDPGLKPDHASLWVRRGLRAAISLLGRLVWHGADLTVIVCNQTSALGRGPAWSCLPRSRWETWSSLWHFSAAFEPASALSLELFPHFTDRKTEAGRKEGPARPALTLVLLRPSDLLLDLGDLLQDPHGGG